MWFWKTILQSDMCRICAITSTRSVNLSQRKNKLCSFKTWLFQHYNPLGSLGVSATSSFFCMEVVSLAHVVWEGEPPSPLLTLVVQPVWHLHEWNLIISFPSLNSLSDWWYFVLCCILLIILWTSGWNVEVEKFEYFNMLLNHTMLSGLLFANYNLIQLSIPFANRPYESTADGGVGCFWALLVPFQSCNGIFLWTSK